MRYAGLHEQRAGRQIVDIDFGKYRGKIPTDNLAATPSFKGPAIQLHPVVGARLMATRRGAVANEHGLDAADKPGLRFDRDRGQRRLRRGDIARGSNCGRCRRPRFRGAVRFQLHPIPKSTLQRLQSGILGVNPPRIEQLARRQIKQLQVETPCGKLEMPIRRAVDERHASLLVSFFERGRKPLDLVDGHLQGGPRHVDHILIADALDGACEDVAVIQDQHALEGRTLSLGSGWRSNSARQECADESPLPTNCPPRPHAAEGRNGGHGGQYWKLAQGADILDSTAQAPFFACFRMVSSGSRASDSTPQRREVHYSGHVQGVGFRDTVRRLAQGIPVTGFVRNLDDGRVQLVAEGSRGDLKEFLESISHRMAHFIRQAAVDERPATGEFDDFAIRH